MKYKILSCFILIVLIFELPIFATNTYVWSENSSDTTQVNAEAKDNFLNLESESAILIEQNSRSNFI